MHESAGRLRRVHAAPIEGERRAEGIHDDRAVIFMGVVAVEIAVDEPGGCFVPGGPSISQDGIPTWKSGIAQPGVFGRQGFVDLQDGGTVKSGVHGTALDPGGHQARAESWIVGGETCGELPE